VNDFLVLHVCAHVCVCICAYSYEFLYFLRSQMFVLCGRLSGPIFVRACMDACVRVCLCVNVRLNASICVCMYAHT